MTGQARARQTASQIRAERDAAVAERDELRIDLERCRAENATIQRDLIRAAEKAHQEATELRAMIRLVADRHTVRVGIDGSGVACRECGMLSPCPTRIGLLGETEARKGHRRDSRADNRHA